MIIRTLTLVFILLFSVCKAQNVDYAGGLKGCLTDADISLLNEACRIFELHLTNHYKNQSTGEVYKSFLEDVSVMNLPPQFFATTKCKEMIGKLKSGKSFEKIWTNLSKSDKQQPSNSNIESGYYCMAPNGIFLNCLIERNTVAGMNEYLDARRIMHGISPALTVNMLKNSLKPDDYNNDHVRLIIAIGFYYEIYLLTNKAEIVR